MAYKVPLSSKLLPFAFFVLISPIYLLCFRHPRSFAMYSLNIPTTPHLRLSARTHLLQTSTWLPSSTLTFSLSVSFNEVFSKAVYLQI